MSPATTVRIKQVFAGLGVILALATAFQTPPEGVPQTTMYAVGISIWAVFWWATGVIPEYATGLIMCTLFASVKAVPFKVAYAAFAGPVFWLTVTAFVLGAMAGKVGLLKRMALWVLKIFPPTFNGQVWGLIVSGLVISPLVPSTNGKAALSSPLGLTISDTLGLKRGGKAASGLFLACMTGFYLTSTLFLSGTGSNYMFLGLIGGASGNVSWIAWFVRAIVFTIILMLGLGTYICLFCKPDKPVSLPPSYIKEQLEAIGPMSRDERWTLGIMLVTLLLWMTESLHGVKSGEVGVLAICALMVTKVMTRQDFNNRVAWPAVIFIGTLLNMAGVVQALKLDKLLGSALAPVLSAVASNPYTMVLAIIVSLFILKFAIVSVLTSAVISFFIFSAVAPSLGVDPWIVAFVAWTSSHIYIFPYQNSAYLCGHYAAGSEMVDHSEGRKHSFVFVMLCVLAGMASVPFWHMLGLIK